MGSLHPLQSGAFVVARPRAGDAVGAALRDAYMRDARVPEDMMALLAQLNCNRGGRSAY